MQFDWDWDTAEDLLREAVTLNPNNATAQQWLGELYCYRSAGRGLPASTRNRAGTRSLVAATQLMQGSPALWAEQYEAALEVYSGALEEAPDFPFGIYFLGLAHAGLGEWAAALDAYEAALPALGLAIVGGPMIHARARLGDFVSARSTLVGTRGARCRALRSAQQAGRCLSRTGGNGNRRWSGSQERSIRPTIGWSTLPWMSITANCTTTPISALSPSGSGCCRYSIADSRTAWKPIDRLIHAWRAARQFPPQAA